MEKDHSFVLSQQGTQILRYKSNSYTIMRKYPTKKRWHCCNYHLAKGSCKAGLFTTCENKKSKIVKVFISRKIIYIKNKKFTGYKS